MRVLCLLVALSAVVATPVAAQTSLTQGTVYTTSTSPSSFSITPQGGWNAFAVSSPATDWDIYTGLAGYRTGQSGLGAADFVVSSDGTDAGAGLFQPSEVSRISGTNGCWLQHATRSIVTPGSSTGYAWQNSDVVHIWTVSIGQTGQSAVAISGSFSSDFAWYVFAPTGALSWASRTSATYGPFDTSAARLINFTESGTWCVVLVHNNGPLGSSPTMTLTVPVPVPTGSSGDGGGGDGDDGGCTTGSSRISATYWLLGVAIVAVLAWFRRKPLATKLR